MQPAPHCPALVHWWQMRAFGLLLCWQLQLGMYSVFFLFVCLFLSFFLLVMLPSEVPKLPTDPPVRGLPTVWKLLLFHDSLSRSLTLVSLFVFYILSYLILKRMGCIWVPGVLHQCSEVVLWKLLSIQMIFWWICGGESGLPILFLCHLGTAHSLSCSFSVIYSSLPHRNITFSICSCKTVRAFLDPFSFLEMPINCFLINVLTIMTWQILSKDLTLTQFNHNSSELPWILRTAGLVYVCAHTQKTTFL